ncbi:MULTISPECIES: hypothetical protein [Cryobacterium]|uniref:CHAP domain-containing protein n=1 Tax=Cryobacterium breve TaxID=1259258 RepID=A0ABY2J808_9MICO|nr:MULTISPECIES: hypothetical protein [Cryobacterium]TFC92035.1 hypothetical protein E3T20_12020 [Cryobacterium sp. TmT3-12]TFC99826.1 hypothetical protein E3O65_05485 [Cryobacterium breve]
MTNTPAEFIAYCLAHPQDRDGSTWDQKCVALVFRAGGFTDSRNSAYRAALATEAAGHKLDTTTPLDRLPAGWFVYFDKAGPDNGHIGMTTGNGQFGSANWRAKGWGTALGQMSIQFYIDSGARYMGASPYFINTTLDLSGLASLDLTPVIEKRRPMSALIRNYDGSIGLVTEDGELIPLASMTEVDSLRATGIVGDFVQMPDGLIWNTLTAITGRKLVQRSGNPDATAAALAPLLVSAVVAGLAGTGSGLTEEQVAQATEAAVRAVFADAAK